MLELQRNEMCCGQMCDALYRARLSLTHRCVTVLLVQALTTRFGAKHSGRHLVSLSYKE